MAESRTEYRVVASGSHLHGGSHVSPVMHEKGVAETYAFEMQRYHKTVRIQTRTGTATPWTDLPEKEGES